MYHLLSIYSYVKFVHYILGHLRVATELEIQFQTSTKQSHRFHINSVKFHLLRLIVLAHNYVVNLKWQSVS